MIVERRVKTDGSVLVKLDSGEWIPEQVAEAVSEEPDSLSEEEE